MTENRKIPLYQALARDVVWLSQVNDTYRDQAEARLAYHSDFLPSGAGIDCGTKIDVEASRDTRLVLHLSYHHMNEAGYYNGWTEHTIKVTPSLSSGFNLSISGRDRNDTKDYLADLYDSVLTELVPEYAPAEFENR